MSMDYIAKTSQVSSYLEEVLSAGRYAHCLRVGDLAREMAVAYDYDENKAYLAGILHDIAKKREDELLTKYDITCYVAEEDWDYYFPVLHSPLGYMEAEEAMNIDDEDILNSILYHTTGRPGMSLLEKIVYLADASEVGRKGDHVEKIRRTAFEDLDKALVKTMDIGLESCIKRGQLIHPLTLEARNYYLRKGVDLD